MMDNIDTSAGVERLSPYAVDGGCDAYGEMEPDDYGDYVSLESYSELAASRDTVIAERDRQYDQNAEQITRMAALELERNAIRAEVERLRADAARYQWLRGRDLNTIQSGGVFVGMTPQNCVINDGDLDLEVDNAMRAEARASTKGGDT